MNNCCNNLYPEMDMKRWESCPSTMLANADNYYTKAQVDEKLEDISISGGGITSGEVQSMIDAATEPIEGSVEALSGAVEQLSTDLENKADKSDIPSLDNYYNKTEVNAIIEDNEYTISQAINDLNDRKLDASAYTPVDLSNYWTSAETQNAINAATSGTPSSATIERLRTDVNALSGDVSNLYETKLDASAYTPTDLSNYWTSAQTKNYVDTAISGIPSGALAVDWSELVDQQLMTDAKWNEIVDAIQNHREVYGYLDYSADGGGVEIYPLMSAANIGIQGSNDSIILNSQSGDGTYILTITKNGSNDYSFSDSSYRFQPKLIPGSGISISNNNVISVTGGTSGTIDQSLDSGSTNAVANSAITAALDDKMDVSGMTQYATTANTYTKTEVNNLVSTKANVWCGDETSFNALTTKDANTIYLVY